MDLIKFLLISITIVVCSAQLRSNRKQLNSQLYSQILSNLEPEFDNSINNNYEPNYDEIDDEVMRNPRGDKIYTENLCSEKIEVVDLSSDSFYEYHPKVFRNVTCKNSFSNYAYDPRSFKSEQCHRIQGIGLTGCFNAFHQEFILRRRRSDSEDFSWEVDVTTISECKCMKVKPKNHGHGK